eukprot:gene10760-10916_t
MAQPSNNVNKGLSILEWTSKLVPQGALVTGARTGWRLAWQTMVRELAPQDQTGSYARPTAAFDEEVYEKLSPGYRGRCTAPLLMDKKLMKPVSTESSSIVRMLSQLQLPGTTDADLYPPQLQQQIDSMNEKVYRSINNGVYRCGFSTSQAGYDAAVGELHQLMAQLDQQLGQTRFLLGDRFTEADLRLFPTICRFDAVYAGIFRCGRRRVADYPNIQAWMRDVWQIKIPGGGLQVSDTVDIDACRESYYTNLFPLNPSGIIVSGPTAADLQLNLPAGRGSHDISSMFYQKQQPLTAATAAFKTGGATQ